jgi:hypothetical protein
MAFPFTLKSILRQKKNMEFKYFTMQKYNFKKSSKKDQNPSRYHNFIPNPKFQHEPKYNF